MATDHNRREPVRLDDQEEHDQGAEDHRFEVRHRGRADLPADHGAQRRQRLVEEDRQQHDEGGAQHAAQDRAQAADDDHEQELEGAVDVEGRRLPRAEIDEGPQRARHADQERRHGEGGELGVHRPDADDLGGDVHVADRHPLAADMAAHDVLGGERQHDGEGERRPGSSPVGERQVEAEDLERRRVDRAGRRVVGQPLDAQERPVGEELRGERGARRDRSP